MAYGGSQIAALPRPSKNIEPVSGAGLVAGHPYAIEVCDAGRLLINARFRRMLEANRLTTFAALFHVAGGELVRAVGSRTTTRVDLQAGADEQTFFLKRHRPAGLFERLKPLFHLSRSIVGARNEWEAILRFHAAGLPTMTPVAFGEFQGHSLVMTQDLKADQTLLDWVNETAGNRRPAVPNEAADSRPIKRELIHRVAAISRRMHDCGLCHQDFYLNHLLCCGDPARLDVRVIDLGRVRWRPKSSLRSIVKDLAQLDYSARGLSCADRLRFLRLYLGRPFRPADRWLVRWIVMKSKHIAAHTAKNGL